MTSQPSVGDTPLRSFIDRYFEAWSGGVPEKVLGYFGEDAVINIWGSQGTLAGKKMVAEHWVIPTVTKYPDNIHHIESFFEAGEQVVVEWLFTASHVAKGKEISVRGCSIYWVSGGLIQRGNVYFNIPQAKRDKGLPILNPPDHPDRPSETGQSMLTNL